MGDRGRALSEAARRDTRRYARDLPPLTLRGEALSSGDSLLALRAHALDAIVALVPASAALFVSISRRLAIESAVAVVDPDVELQWADYVTQQARQDPFGPRRLDPPDATVLVLEQVEQAAPGYSEALRAAGWDDRLAIYLRLAGTVVAVVSLLRAGGGPRFSTADASQLRRIQPLLEHAYASALDPHSESPRDVLRSSGLTAREADVAELVGRGASNAEISRSLHVAEATVKTHLTRIYTKVGVRTRTQLALLVGAGT